MLIVIVAGIQVTPNSSRVLRKFGVDKFIQRNATEPIDLKMMRWEDGQMLVETPLKSAADERYGSPYWHIHRADFHRGLLERATELGVKLYMDSRIVEVDPYGPSVLTKNGTRFSADLVVCSDGELLELFPSSG
jgi:salicylate hydroxylase